MKIFPQGSTGQLFILSIIAIFCAALLVSSGSAAAYNGTCGDNLTWNLNTASGVLKISGTGDMDNYFYHSGTELPGWYAYRDSITSLSLDPRITSIGDCAFYQCTALQNVMIPNSVTTLGYYAFYRCNALKYVTLGSGITIIRIGAFEDCSSLVSIIIPDSVTTISERAFNNCNALTSVTIGKSIKSIGNSAFQSCYNVNIVDLAASTDLAAVGANAFGYDPSTSLEYGSSIYVPDSTAAALFNETNYYPTFTNLKYLITYNANDGSGNVVKDNVQVSVSTYVIAADTFTRTGYTFAGWNSKADGSGISYAQNAPFSVTKSVIFYAVWVAVPTGNEYSSVTAVVSLADTTDGLTGRFVFSDSPVNTIMIDGVMSENASITITEGLTFGVSSPYGSVAHTFDITPNSVSSINTSIISFSIPVFEITKTGFCTSDVTLQHYEDETWRRIPTTLSKVENGYANYTAVIDEYSLFAITFSRGATDVIATPTPTVIPDTPTEMPTTAVPTGTPSSKPASTASPVPLAGILSGLGLAAYLRYGRR